MARHIILIGNWKMQHDLHSSVYAASGLAELLADESLPDTLELMVCPSFESLAAVEDVLSTSPVRVGAQDVFWEERGAYTGEVSAASLKLLGCAGVIIGHSERRKYQHETDDIVNRKVQAALKAGLVPIVCVGEHEHERYAGSADHVVANQVTAAFDGIELRASQHVIVAYEPVWAIGTGNACAPKEASHMAQVIRQSLVDRWDEDITDRQTRVVYGGSVDAENIREYLTSSVIRGALIGGASVAPESFMQLIRSVNV